MLPLIVPWLTITWLPWVPFGAGRTAETVPAAEATPEKVRAAVAKVLTNGRYLEAANRVATESAAAGGATGVAQDLEALCL